MFWFFLWAVCAIATFGLVNDTYRIECVEKKIRAPAYDQKFWIFFCIMVLLGPIGLVMAWINNKEAHKGAKFEFSYSMDDLPSEGDTS